MDLLVPIIARIDGERRAGIAVPVRGIQGLGRNGGGEQVQGLPWIAPRQSHVALAPQLLGRLARDQARALGGQGLLQPDSLTCQISLAEAFLRLSGKCGGRQACSNQNGAQQRPDHGMFLAFTCRRMLRPYHQVTRPTLARRGRIWENDPTSEVSLMDRPRSRALVLSSLMLATLLAVSPRPVRAQAPSPDAAIDAARSAFEALADTDRKAIQDALIWTGDYSGVTDGTFGRQTYAAIAAFQTRMQQPPNGILTPQARSALLSAAQQARGAAGFTLVDDPKTGIRIGIPTKILPKQSVNPTGGSRWQSADDRVTLDTRSAPPDATLQTLYDRSTAIQSPGRVVSYKVLRPDFFVVAGETAGGKFYTRYGSGPEGLRGFSIGYDKAVAPQVDRLVVAIANSFTPFPAQATPAPIAQNPVPAPQQVQNKPQAPKRDRNRDRNRQLADRDHGPHRVLQGCAGVRPQASSDHRPRPLRAGLRRYREGAAAEGQSRESCRGRLCSHRVGTVAA